MASRFRKVVAAKLETVGEYVYLWNKLLYPVLLVNLFVRALWLCYC